MTDRLWYLLTCTHYGAMPRRGRKPERAWCEVCNTTRAIVREATP